jgi:hypothetical protein
MKTKICSKCKKEYPSTPEYFNRSSNIKSGLISRCKKCKRAIDRIYSRKYREKHPQWKKADNKKRQEQTAKLIKKWREEHPEIIKCWRIYRMALKNGILIRKPCEICGSKKVHGHHDDYSKPLEVRWLCPKHHKAVEFNLIDLGPILKQKETAQI